MPQLALSTPKRKLAPGETAVPGQQAGMYSPGGPATPDMARKAMMGPSYPSVPQAAQAPQPLQPTQSPYTYAPPQQAQQALRGSATSGAAPQPSNSSPAVFGGNTGGLAGRLFGENPYQTVGQPTGRFHLPWESRTQYRPEVWNRLIELSLTGQNPAILQTLGRDSNGYLLPPGMSFQPAQGVGSNEIAQALMGDVESQRQAMEAQAANEQAALGELRSGYGDVAGRRDEYTQALSAAQDYIGDATDRSRAGLEEAAGAFRNLGPTGEQYREEALTAAAEKEAEALGGFKDSTAAQMQMNSQAVKQELSAQESDIIGQVRSGKMTEAQGQAELRKVRMATSMQLGNMAANLETTYNQTVLKAQEDFANLSAQVRTAADTLAMGAGTEGARGLLQTGQVMAALEQASASERAQYEQQKVSLGLSLDRLRLQGSESMARLLGTMSVFHQQMTPVIQAIAEMQSAEAHEAASQRSPLYGMTWKKESPDNLSPYAGQVYPLGSTNTRVNARPWRRTV